MVVSAGAEIVVVLPETHVTVPPVARAVATNGSELPPVLPPEQPLTTMVLEMFPVIVVQDIFPPAAPAVPANPSVRAEIGTVSTANVSKSFRMHFLLIVPGRPGRATLDMKHRLPGRQ
jgi:hypothetical protein